MTCPEFPLWFTPKNPEAVVHFTTDSRGRDPDRPRKPCPGSTTILSTVPWRVRHAACSADAITLDKSCDDLDSFGLRQFVHGPSYC